MMRKIKYCMIYFAFAMTYKKSFDGISFMICRWTPNIYTHLHFRNKKNSWSEEVHMNFSSDYYSGFSMYYKY